MNLGVVQNNSEISNLGIRTLTQSGPRHCRTNRPVAVGALDMSSIDFAALSDACGESIVGKSMGSMLKLGNVDAIFGSIIVLVIAMLFLTANFLLLVKRLVDECICILLSLGARYKIRVVNWRIWTQ